MTTFADLGLPDSLVSVLDRRGITEPFPIQHATIPDALAGRDVCGKAPTGSGKTLAFGLPLLARIGKARRGRPTGLILAPTRELADQIHRELTSPAKATSRFVASVYGGVGYGPQKAALRRGVDVLVATPGRLEDLIEQGDVDLGAIEVAVVDEADRMADMGFLPAVRRILDQAPADRQTLLFSATLDGDIAVLSRAYQRGAVRHEAASVETDVDDALHLFWLTAHEERVPVTADLLHAVPSSIVFTRTRRGADRLAKQLAARGVDAVVMHGGRSQSQRTRALKAFSRGDATALIATDVAARGIHVDAVSTVVHFDPPADHKDYLHRSGRTARAGEGGVVVSIVTSQQRRDVKRLQRDLSVDEPIAEPDLAAVEDALASGSGRRRQPAPAHTGSRSPRRAAPENGRRSRPADRAGSSPRGQSESIYVANLPWEATADDLAVLFSRYGAVHDSTIIKDRRGRSKGFGFVAMPRGDAKQAIDDLQGASLEGRPLTVRVAKPRSA